MTELNNHSRLHGELFLHSVQPPGILLRWQQMSCLCISTDNNYHPHIQIHIFPNPWNHQMPMRVFDLVRSLWKSVTQNRWATHLIGYENGPRVWLVRGPWTKTLGHADHTVVVHRRRDLSVNCLSKYTANKNGNTVRINTVYLVSVRKIYSLWTDNLWCWIFMDMLL